MQRENGQTPPHDGPDSTGPGAADPLRRIEARYRQLFDSIDQGFCVIEMIHDAEGRPIDYRFIEANQMFGRQTGLSDATARTMREHAPDHEQHWFDTYGRIASMWTPERFEAPAAALAREYEVYAFPFDEPELHRVGVLFNDITSRKQSERFQQMLIGELNHRVRNLFGVVQSLARQTFRGGDPERLRTYLGRLSALLAAHDLLPAGEWRSVGLHDILRKALAPYDADRRIMLEGPAVDLDVKAAQSLSLTFHEMATNAAKYGALSNAEGRVAVRWEIDRAGDRLVLHWIETGGPPVEAEPERSGFGSQLIANTLSHDATVRVQIDRPATGVTLTIDATLSALTRGPD